MSKGAAAPAGERNGMDNELLPSEIRLQIELYTKRLVDLFAETLLGLYVYGSIARGCYHQVTSDVDVIGIISKVPTTDVINKVCQVHQTAGMPIDAVFVTADQIQTNTFPAPVAFLVKPIDGEGRVVMMPEGCRDFLLQRQDAHEVGLALYGPPSRQLLSPVPWPLLKQSLDYLFPYITTHFKNPVLMLCRIAYAHTHHTLCSKEEAGAWAAKVFVSDWKPIVQAALTEYANGATRSTIRKETLQLFEAWCSEYIQRLGGRVA